MAKFTSEQMYDVPWVTTRYGSFNLNEPTFDIRDIAHALPMLCRFNGQITRFYSVGQHSLMVAHIMEDLSLGNPLEGLLHDATEAYLSDVPSPFKHALPDWQAIDHRCELALREHFKLGPKTEGCKTADWLALYMEAYELLPGGGEQFPDPHCLRNEALRLLSTRDYGSFKGRSSYKAHYAASEGATPQHVTDMFLDRFEELIAGS